MVCAFGNPQWGYSYFPVLSVQKQHWCMNTGATLCCLWCDWSFALSSWVKFFHHRNIWTLKVQNALAFASWHNINKVLRGPWIKNEVPLCRYIESMQTESWGKTTHLIGALKQRKFLEVISHGPRSISEILFPVKVNKSTDGPGLSHCELISEFPRTSPRVLTVTNLLHF